MKPSASPSGTAADEQASLWAARLDGGTLSAADRIALDEWLEAHPSHRGLLSAYCQFSTDLELLLPALPKPADLPAATAGKTTPPRRNLFWLAAVPIAAAFVFVFWPGTVPHQSDRYATSAAERQTIRLADGSRAELNALTSVQVDITARERRVRLAAGQALFTVTEDKARPFIVETPAGSVEVTGTVFEVRSENSHLLDVLVASGSVQVRPTVSPEGRHFAPRSLAAGDRLSAGNGEIRTQTLSTAQLDAALAWRHGQAVFADDRLDEALARFARYHGRGITAASGAGELRLGGRFSLDDLDGFLAALESVLPVRVTRSLSGTIQVHLVDAG
ncbi:MAG: FecR domain-containing protein [Opitutaceae bacterium]|nr:FecR domain-containing protein [Opitutaceae bacterium]